MLMIAASKGQSEIVQALLAASANVNAVTIDDRVTPLMFAAAFGHLPIVEALVESGTADLTLKDRSDRRTAVEWAAVRATLKWAAPGPRAEEEMKGQAIMKYLASKGALVRKIDIVEGILTFASMPDLAELVTATEAAK